MKKRALVITGVAVVLLAAGFFAYRTLASSRSNAASSVQTATVELGSLSSALSSSGNTRSGQSATISWETSGKVGEVTLQVGDTVEDGQVLAALDSNTLSTEMIQARQDLLNAQQTLDDLQNSKTQAAKAQQAVEDAQKALDSLKQTAASQAAAAQKALADAQAAYDDAVKNRQKMDYPHSSDKLVIEKAQTEYLLAKQTYKEALVAYNLVDQKRLIDPDRVRALNNLVTAEQNMKTKLATYNWYLLNYTSTDIAQADAEVAVAKAALDSAQADWDQLKDGASSAEVAMAEATLADAKREYERVKDGPSQTDLEAAQAAVDAAQATLDYAQLLAPFSGTLTDVEVKTGDLVSKGTTAFRIDDLSSIYIDLQISEVDLASLKVGQPATVEFDAIADKTYTGEVTQIGMVGTVSNGVVNYPVTVKITDGDGSIRTGMTASVSIETAHADNVLLVPNKAIRTVGGQKTVTVLFEGQQISVPVTVGLVGDSQSEVTSSQLRHGDTVVITGSTSTTTSSTSGGNNRFNGPGGDIGGFGGPPPGAVP